MERPGKHDRALGSKPAVEKRIVYVRVNIVALSSVCENLLILTIFAHLTHNCIVTLSG
jgi:hypothetical protein